MKIHIIIPVHNRKDLTEACLKSLMHQSYQDIKIIVIDDGSTDGTNEMIKKQFANVEIIQGDGNLWWTGSINKGIKHVLDFCNPEDYILVLNNDLIVPPNYIANIKEASKLFPNALIGSLVADINCKDIIVSGGVQIDWKTAKWMNLNSGISRISLPSDFNVEVSTLTGRGVLIPTNVFREIGLYDEEHILQCGDTELPIRASKAGYKLIVSYNSVVFNYPEDKDNINHKINYRLTDLVEYYWGNKSHTNLKTRFWFAYSALDKNVLLISRYLFLDFVRITVHFLRRFKVNWSSLLNY
jgi:GT2 family glycosyltransferase